MKQAPTKVPKLKKKKTTKIKWWQIVLYVVGMLVWVWAAITVSQLIVGYLMLWILGSETLAQPVPMTIYSAASYALATVLIILLPLRLPKIIRKQIGRPSREKLGLRGLPTWTDIGLAVVSFIAFYLLAVVLESIFRAFPWFNAEQAQDIGFNLYAPGFDRIVAYIALVIVAPFFEELIFRGWLYRNLRDKLSERIPNSASMIISILLVSILFGILHGQWNVGVNVFALSVILCGLREITGTIYAGMLVHMIKNAIAFFALLFMSTGGF